MPEIIFGIVTGASHTFSSLKEAINYNYYELSSFETFSKQYSSPTDCSNTNSLNNSPKNFDELSWAMKKIIPYIQLV